MKENQTLQVEKKRSSETEDHEKQHLATLKRLKRGDENELERKLRLEKVVASKQLRLAMETEEQRRTRLENDAATKRLRLAMETDEVRLEKMVAQVVPGDRGRKKSNKKGMDLIWFNLDLIWIEIGSFKKQKISRNELARPVMGTIFLVSDNMGRSDILG